MKTIISLDGQTKRLDSQYVDFLNEANRHFLKRPDYVGVAPYGSHFKGCTTPESDFDCILIAGDSRVDTQIQLQDELKKIGERFGKAANSPSIWSADHFEINLRPDPDCDSHYGHALWPLAYPFIGRTHTLQKFKAFARTRHRQTKKHDPSQAHYNLTDAVHGLLFWEMGVDVSFVDDNIIRSRLVGMGISEKLLTRGYTSSQLRDLAVKRAHMWLAHIRKMVRN